MRFCPIKYTKQFSQIDKLQCCLCCPVSKLLCQALPGLRFLVCHRAQLNVHDSAKVDEQRPEPAVSANNILCAVEIPHVATSLDCATNSARLKQLLNRVLVGLHECLRDLAHCRERLLQRLVIVLFTRVSAQQRPESRLLNVSAQPLSDLVILLKLFHEERELWKSDDAENRVQQLHHAVCDVCPGRNLRGIVSDRLVHAEQMEAVLPTQ